MVETAKVDIRKLQQLNDRINQCLDALNQVRLSVHGLSHTTGAFPQIGQQIGQQQVGQLGFAGAQDPRFGINPLAQGGIAGFAQPYGVQSYGGGLSHTGAIGQPFQQSPFAAWNPALNPALSQMVNPMLAQQAAFAPFAQFGGLSHTGAEGIESFAKPAWADPLLQAKVAQTFPYAQYAVPPIVSLY